MKKNQKTANKAPALRFSPTAWAKLLYLRDVGDSEIGGFGITAAADLLLVEDIVLVEQTASWISVEFCDQAVADYFDAQVDAGRRPEEFGRIWIHTHPGSSPQPSSTDERTFERVFGGSDWAVMFILARGGQTYCRLRFNVGPEGELAIPVDVDYSSAFSASDHSAWLEEYSACVRIPPPEPKQLKPAPRLAAAAADEPFDDRWYDAWAEYLSYDGLPIEEPYSYVHDF